MYKDTVALDIMQTKGGEDGLPEEGNPSDDDNTDDTMDLSDSGRSEREDIVHETTHCLIRIISYFALHSP